MTENKRQSSVETRRHDEARTRRHPKPQMQHLKNKATSKAEYTNTQQGLPD